MTQLTVVACILVGVVLTAVLRRHLPSPAAVVLVALVLIGGLAGVGSRYSAMVDQTEYWRSLGLTEAGTSSLDVKPPVPPELVHAAREVLRPGESWALITDRGTCREFRYAFFWTAYLLLPNVADCEDPDVRLLLRVPPEDEGTVVVARDAFWVVRP